MNHIISGSSFHGFFRVTLRGAANGFWLSASQRKKLRDAQCPSHAEGCCCGGNYGDGLDDDSAEVEYGDDTARLVPAGFREAEALAEAKAADVYWASLPEPGY